MPSELIDLTGEIAVWAILGVVLIAQFSDIGLETFNVSSQATLAAVAQHVATVINLVGSRRVDVHLELPRISMVGEYIVRLSERNILVESKRDSQLCQARYPSVSTVLKSGHRYSASFSEGGILFLEV